MARQAVRARGNALYIIIRHDHTITQTISGDVRHLDELTQFFGRYASKTFLSAVSWVP